MTAYIPASWAATGYGVPTVCVAHGEPTADRIVVPLRSPTPYWIYVMILAGGLVVGGILALFLLPQVRRTMVAVWPYCPGCRALRVRNVLFGAGLAVTGCLGVGLGIMAYDGSGLIQFVIVASAVCGLLSLPYALRSTPAAITGAELSEDGYWVVVNRPSPAFAAATPRWTAPAPAAAPQAAAPQAAAPQAAPAQAAPQAAPAETGTTADDGDRVTP